MNPHAEAGLDYRDSDRMQTMHRAPAVFRHVDYGWALNDKTVQKVIATHIAILTTARAVPDTLDKVRALDVLAVDMLSRSSSREHRMCAAVARRVGGIAPYYAALVYRAIRLGEDSCEMAEEFQTSPWGIRQTLYRLNQTAQKIEAGETLLRTDFLTHHTRRNRFGPRPRWSLDDAIPLRLAGFSYVEIGAKFGVTGRMVNIAFVKAGIISPVASRPRPKARRYNHVECFELRRAGWKIGNLAERYHVSYRVIQEGIRQELLAQRPPGMARPVESVTNAA